MFEFGLVMVSCLVVDLTTDTAGAPDGRRLCSQTKHRVFLSKLRVSNILPHSSLTEYRPSHQLSLLILISRYTLSTRFVHSLSLVLAS